MRSTPQGFLPSLLEEAAEAVRSSGREGFGQHWRRDLWIGAGTLYGAYIGSFAGAATGAALGANRTGLPKRDRLVHALLGSSVGFVPVVAHAAAARSDYTFQFNSVAFALFLDIAVATLAAMRYCLVPARQ